MTDLLHEVRGSALYQRNRENIDEALNVFEDIKNQFAGILPLDEYPLIGSEGELSRFFDFVQLMDRARVFLGRSPSESIRGLERAIEVSLSVNSYCLKSCLDCISDSSSQGVQVPFSDLTGFSDDFFRIIKAVKLGMEGEPLLYSNSGENLGDVIEEYLERGIGFFTLSTGCPIQTEAVEETLARIHALSGSMKGFYPRLTYSLYPVGRNTRKAERNDQDFIALLKNLLPISTTMNVQVRGDFFFEETNIIKTAEHFDELMQRSGFKRKNPVSIGNNITEYSLNEHTANVYLQAFVFPSDRLRKSVEAGLLTPSQEYRFRDVETSHVCYHLFNYDSFAVMANGDIRLCDVIYSYANPGTIVKNIYRPDGEEELFRKLDKYHIRCKTYFLSNFREIMRGEKPTCLCKLDL